MTNYFYNALHPEAKEEGFIPVQDFRVPLISSFISRTICLTLFYPLEHRMTVLMSQSLSSCSLFSKKAYVGFTSAYTRDISYSLIFWPLNENLKIYFKKSWSIESEVTQNVLSASVASSIASIFTFPSDFVRMARVSGENKFDSVSNTKIFRIILSQVGFRGLLPSKL